MGKIRKLRCGLCDIEVEGSFADHVKSEQHQSNLPKVEAVKMPEVPVRVVSDAEKKQNRDKVAKATNLGYVSEANGRSGSNLRCECGEVSFVFAWKGCRRCSNCGKLLHSSLSFRESG